MSEALDRTILASPPLVVTLAQVRFEARPELARASVAAALRSPMAEHGLTSVTQVQTQQVVVGAPSVGASDTAKTAAGWQFKAPSDAVVVTVLQDQLTLEVKRYPGWDSFVDLWRSCIDGVTEVVRPEVVTRLGLRYVNKVQPHAGVDAAGWAASDLLDPAFLGPAVGSTLSKHVRGTEGRTVLSFEDAAEALVHHGVVLEDNGAVFMLDIDCSSTQIGDFTTEVLTTRLAELNDHSLAVFQAVVRPALRAKMMGAKGEVL